MVKVGKFKVRLVKDIIFIILVPSQHKYICHSFFSQEMC